MLMKTSLLLAITLAIFTSSLYAGPMTEKKIGTINTLKGSYTSLVIRPGGKKKDFQYFTEQAQSGTVEERCIDTNDDYYCPGILIQNGSSPTKISSPRLVVDTWKLAKEVKLTRNAVVFSTKDNRYYALGYVNYGAPQTGYFFRSLNADPKGEWETLGPISSVKGGYSGTNLIVNDDYQGTSVNHADPLKNKFIHYTSLGSKFLLMYSIDGREWHTFRKANGDENVRPDNFKTEVWNFASVVKTKSGYFMSVSVGWNPILVHRLLYSTDGLDWSRQIGTENGGNDNAKNYSLSYDKSTDTVYVMQTASPSKHYKILYSFIATLKAPKSL